ncbi:MAG: helix-turn-helix domain-containing protein [Bacilli bacterium]|nr:helix-turn-helix domain-containing protein [Bacilli bacterium]MCH4235184.1 helix-turn-helix domain-containing protein [Bacilli bacterium]HMM00846.1 helix-turn-helix transcriptional regulator [Bacilli bacterium]
MKNNSSVSIGKRIRERRIAINMSIERLAKILDVDRSTIYRYETDSIKKMSYEVLLPLADALKTTPFYLVNGTVEQGSALDDTPIIRFYNQLTSENKDKVDKYVRDLLQLQKLQESNINSDND